VSPPPLDPLLGIADRPVFVLMSDFERRDAMNPVSRRISVSLATFDLERPNLAR